MAGNTLTIEGAIEQIVQGVGPRLIAIDGLPCAGKSAMARELERQMEAECIGLDEFILPERGWSLKRRPAFPFEYVRYDAFLDAVEALATVGECSFHPFDWTSLEVSRVARVVRRTGPIVIEGVSSLNPKLCDFYDTRVFVESDRATTLQAAIRRGVGPWKREWRDLFLPSVDLYMLAQPQSRADILVAGRGVSAQESCY